MSPREVRLLTLMAQKARNDMGQVSAELVHVKTQQMQSFDLSDRLHQMREQLTPSANQALSPGQLATAMWMGQTLSQQIETMQTRMAEMQAQQKQLEQELGLKGQKERVLADRCEKARQGLRRTRQEAAYADLSRPRPR